jgi:hypothetical protein
VAGGDIGGKATAGGGVSPQQQALAQYNFGQNEIQNNAQFAQLPLSTMKTQADTGAFANKALQLSQMSDADAKAMAAAINQQVAGIGSAIGGLGSALGGSGA